MFFSTPLSSRLVEADTAGATLDVTPPATDKHLVEPQVSFAVQLR
jgi:hypothetical protein